MLTDPEYLSLLPIVKIKNEKPKQMQWLTQKDAVKYAKDCLEFYKHKQQEQQKICMLCKPY